MPSGERGNCKYIKQLLTSYFENTMMCFEKLSQTSQLLNPIFILLKLSTRSLSVLGI